jgi:hypothetical protein
MPLLQSKSKALACKRAKNMPPRAATKDLYLSNSASQDCAVPPSFLVALLLVSCLQYQSAICAVPASSIFSPPLSLLQTSATLPGGTCPHSRPPAHPCRIESVSACVPTARQRHPSASFASWEVGRPVETDFPAPKCWSQQFGPSNPLLPLVSLSSVVALHLVLNLQKDLRCWTPE